MQLQAEGRLAEVAVAGEEASRVSISSGRAPVVLYQGAQGLLVEGAQLGVVQGVQDAVEAQVTVGHQAPRAVDPAPDAQGLPRLARVGEGGEGLVGVGGPGGDGGEAQAPEGPRSSSPVAWTSCATRRQRPRCPGSPGGSRRGGQLADHHQLGAVGAHQGHPSGPPEGARPRRRGGGRAVAAARRRRR